MGLPIRGASHGTVELVTSIAHFALFSFKITRVMKAYIIAVTFANIEIIFLRKVGLDSLTSKSTSVIEVLIPKG